VGTNGFGGIVKGVAPKEELVGTNGFCGIVKGVAAVDYYVNWEIQGDFSSFSEGSPSLLIFDFSFCSPLVIVYIGA